MIRPHTRVSRRAFGRRLFSSSNHTLQDVRPPTAPKQFPDIKSIRANVDLYEQNTVLRNYQRHRHTPKRIAELSDKTSRIAKQSVEPRQKLKKLEKELGALRARKQEDGAANILEQIAPLRKQVDELESEQNAHSEEARKLALSLPNLTSPHTPTDGEFKVLSYINYNEKNPPVFSKHADHSTIGQSLDILNFTSASAATGWGFYYLLNEAALLEQALVQYALSVAMRHGWRVASPPSLVYSHIADSCGFQPRDANDEQQIWQVAQSEKDVGKPKRSLAATAEIPLAALYANRDIPEEQLPLKLVGSSRCYRAEAGARGVDTKGLYRVHEFTKVEMFAWADCDASESRERWTEQSTAVFDEMVKIQIEILSTLGLPCRVMEMPTSDLGASAYRKIDIEALFPSRMSRDGGWGELTSVSICTDYQSRRLDTRVKERSGARSKFPHTVNGTALAVPRVLAAILEHGWQEGQGCVLIPEVLRPFMAGMTQIGPRRI